MEEGKEDTDDVKHSVTHPLAELSSEDSKTLVNDLMEWMISVTQNTVDNWVVRKAALVLVSNSCSDWHCLAAVLDSEATHWCPAGPVRMLVQRVIVTARADEEIWWKK